MLKSYNFNLTRSYKKCSSVRSKGHTIMKTVFLNRLYGIWPKRVGLSPPHKLGCCMVFVRSTGQKGRQTVQKYTSQVVQFYTYENGRSKPVNPYIKSYNLMYKRGPLKVLQRSIFMCHERSKTVMYKFGPGQNLAYQKWPLQNHKSLYKAI